MPMLSISSLNSLSAAALPAYCLEQGLNMAMFRLPGEGLRCRITVSDRLLAEHDVWSAEGFLTASFLNDRHLLIPADYERVCVAGEFAPAGIKNDKDAPTTDCPPMPEEYGHAVGNIVERLCGRGGKTVFSAVRQARCTYSIAEAFNLLCREYPHAFVFAWYHAGSSEAWIGASPELLLHREGNTLATMALAGTRTAGSTGSWDKKNEEEQRMVADFIACVLENHGIIPGRGVTGTLRAGGVEHIHTPFNTTVAPDVDMGALLQELAPTPAVAGLPRDEALHDIAELECHRRDYYGGYCGSYSPLSMHLAVTLRCMTMQPATGECHLYAGGGITAGSQPLDEWHEVNAKMRTLAAALDLEFIN